MLSRAIYWLVLLLSAGVVGLFGCRTVGNLGYVRGLNMELLATGTFAAVYLSAQLFYVGFLRLFWPTRSPGPLLAESLSHLAALVLLPSLLDLSIPWPHPALDRFALLIYAGAFLLFHVFFKLVSLFASIRSTPAPWVAWLAWDAGAAVCATGAVMLAGAWSEALSVARPQAAESTAPYQVGRTWRLARPVPEGAVAVFELNVGDDAELAFSFANSTERLAEIGDEQDAVYLEFTLAGTTLAHYTTSIALPAGAWGAYRLTPNMVPPGARRCELTWRARKMPEWAKFVPVKPLSTSTRALMVSGPEIHMPATEEQNNLVLILVDGMGTNQISAFGYRRKTTRFLTAWSANTNAFPNAYTPTPETAGAAMTLLTGVNPMRHGIIGEIGAGRRVQTLAEVVSGLHYATAAFTEGEKQENRDLTYGAGFEQGFDFFDAAPGTAETTLHRAMEWIHQHERSKFFIFIRLGELNEPRWEDRYDPSFVSGRTVAPVDIYDSALAYVDRALGAFLTDFQGGSLSPNTTICVAGAYGYDFSAGPFEQPVVGLTEDSLRVPVFFYMPGEIPERRPEIVALEDVCPTLLARLGAHMEHVVDGQDLMRHPLSRYVISMYGRPLTLSMRYGPWRFAWNSGYEPGAGFTGPPQALELVHVDRMRQRGTKINDLANNRELAARYETYLADWLRKQAAQADQSAK